MSARLITATNKLAAACQKMHFSAPATHVYHPLIYAKKSHHAYLRKFANNKKRAVFVGINPGPWGMAQTGVPFGEVAAVRDWMGISANIVAPEYAHEKRPILGFDCPRSEASGRRLWGFFATHFASAADFFEAHIVLNYCPLLFLSIADGRCVNITPDKLTEKQREPLYAACDEFLKHAITVLQPQYLIGIGGFAEQRLQTLAGDGMVVGKMLHPSPASPTANRDFNGIAARQLQQIGLWK